MATVPDYNKLIAAAEGELATHRAWMVTLHNALSVIREAVQQRGAQGSHTARSSTVSVSIGGPGGGTLGDAQAYCEGAISITQGHIDRLVKTLDTLRADKAAYEARVRAGIDRGLTEQQVAEEYAAELANAKFRRQLTNVALVIGAVALVAFVVVLLYRRLRK